MSLSSQDWVESLIFRYFVVNAWCGQLCAVFCPLLHSRTINIACHLPQFTVGCSHKKLAILAVVKLIFEGPFEEKQTNITLNMKCV